MLTRILIAGDRAPWEAALADGLFDGEAELCALPPDGHAPPGAAALIAGDTAPGPVLRAATELAREHHGTLALLAEAIDSREGLPPGTTTRLVAHADRFARALGLDAGDRLALERGAHLHDIGKLRISNDLLLKKSVLDYDDFLNLQAHTTLGAELLASAGIYLDACEIVRSHHECWDGTGYPERLEGEAIPVLARAMKILDVYCAMTSPRGYREGVATPEEGLAHLREERGKHFDPELVDVFLNENVAEA